MGDTGGLRLTRSLGAVDHELDRAIAVTALGDGHYAADLLAGWLIGGALNGGYLRAPIGNVFGIMFNQHWLDRVSARA